MLIALNYLKLVFEWFNILVESWIVGIFNKKSDELHSLRGKLYPLNHSMDSSMIDHGWFYKKSYEN
jgi:hypothetical protein